MTAKSDEVLLDLGRQFKLSLKRARRLNAERERLFNETKRQAQIRGIGRQDLPRWRSLSRQTGYASVANEFDKHHAEAIRLMRRIYRQRATTCEGFAVKLAAVTFDQFDFSLTPHEKVSDVADYQLIRLSRQLTKFTRRHDDGGAS